MRDYSRKYIEGEEWTVGHAHFAKVFYVWRLRDITKPYDVTNPSRVLDNIKYCKKDGTIVYTCPRGEFSSLDEAREMARKMNAQEEMSDAL